MHYVGLLLMHHRMVDRQDRNGLVAVAVWSLALGLLVYADPGRSDLWAPWLWGSLLAVGAVFALGWAAFPDSVQLRALAGAAIASGLAGRAWSLLYGLLMGTNRVAMVLVVLGVVLWGLLAAGAVVVWRRLLPSHRH